MPVWCCAVPTVRVCPADGGDTNVVVHLVVMAPRAGLAALLTRALGFRVRVTDLVLRGTGRRWLRYLDRAAGLALDIADGNRDGSAELALAVAHVVLDHDRMLIGLPGNAYYRTAERRRRLTEAIPVLEARIDTNHLEKQ